MTLKRLEKNHIRHSAKGDSTVGFPKSGNVQGELDQAFKDVSYEIIR